MLSICYNQFGKMRSRDFTIIPINRDSKQGILSFSPENAKWSISNK